MTEQAVDPNVEYAVGRVEEVLRELTGGIGTTGEQAFGYLCEFYFAQAAVWGVLASAMIVVLVLVCRWVLKAIRPPEGQGDDSTTEERLMAGFFLAVVVGVPTVIVCVTFLRYAAALFAPEGYAIQQILGALS